MLVLMTCIIILVLLACSFPRLPSLYLIYCKSFIIFAIYVPVLGSGCLRNRESINDIWFKKSYN